MQLYTPIHPYAPIHPYTPCSLCPHTPECCPYVMGTLGGFCVSQMSWGLLVVSVYLSEISVSVSTSVCPSVHKSYQLLPIIVGHFSTGLDAYGCILSFMLLTSSFLCSVFIMSQGSATMATTATPPCDFP